MICEYCQKEHDGSYGSGRFCCAFCARGFSTRDKRQKINKKVSETLKLNDYKPWNKGLKGFYFTTDETKLKISRRIKELGINSYNDNIKPLRKKLNKRIINSQEEFISGKNIIYNSGYKMIYKPDHLRAWKIGYVYEHLLIMEKILGFQLINGESVHHKDSNRLNNNPDNLMCFITIKDHMRYHWMQAQPEKYVVDQLENGTYSCKRIII